MLWLSMYVSNARITPTKRNSNSHVTNISITSPLGKAKKICVPEVREATATVMVPMGHMTKSIITYLPNNVK